MFNTETILYYFNHLQYVYTFIITYNYQFEKCDEKQKSLYFVEHRSYRIPTEQHD